jgi:hypothetical protein
MNINKIPSTLLSVSLIGSFVFTKQYHYVPRILIIGFAASLSYSFGIITRSSLESRLLK